MFKRFKKITFKFANETIKSYFDENFTKQKASVSCYHSSYNS